MIFVEIINYILIFLIVLLGLAIFYKMFSNYFMKLGGMSRFIISLIFFIPCLISDFITNIIHEVKILPRITYILFLLLSYYSLLQNTFIKWWD